MILLIEDASSIINSLTFTLEVNGYKVISAKSIKESISVIEKEKIDLIILDLSLPDGFGLDLYKDVIKEKDISTIILTAIDDEDIVVDALNNEIDEYMTKPFSTKELLARIKRVLLKKEEKYLIKVKDITYDINKMAVYKNDKRIELTSLELKILNLLFININKVVSRSFLLDKIWEWTGNIVDDHTLTVYLKRIRQKLDTDIIVTLKGIGYRIDE